MKASREEKRLLTHLRSFLILFGLCWSLDCFSWFVNFNIFPWYPTPVFQNLICVRRPSLYFLYFIFDRDGHYNSSNYSENSSFDQLQVINVEINLKSVKYKMFTYDMFDFFCDLWNCVIQINIKIGCTSVLTTFQIKSQYGYHVYLIIVIIHFK